MRRRPASLARDAVSSRTVLHSPDACVLLDVTAPLSTLECLAKLVSDCKSLCRQTEATTVSRTLQAFIKYPQEADRLIAQFSWIAAVRKTRLRPRPNHPVANGLSRHAAELRRL